MSTRLDEVKAQRAAAVAALAAHDATPEARATSARYDAANARFYDANIALEEASRVMGVARKPNVDAIHALPEGFVEWWRCPAHPEAL